MSDPESGSPERRSPEIIEEFIAPKTDDQRISFGAAGPTVPCLQLITYLTEETQAPSHDEIERIIDQTAQCNGSSNFNCCNCNSNSSVKNAKKLSDEITFQSFEGSAKKFTNTKIIDVLKVLLHIDKNQVDNDWFMCFQCVDVLVKLSGLYNEFLALSLSSDAALSKMLTQRNKKVNFTKITPSERHTEENDERCSDNSSLKQTRYADSVSLRPKKAQSTKTLVVNKARSIPIVYRETNQPLRTEVTFRKKRSRQDASVISEEHGLDSSSDTCNRCGKHFKNFAGLKIHYAAHLRDDNKLECQECGKKFRNDEALNLHVRVDHKGFKPHKCPHEGCERSFRLKDKLRLHIKVIHEKNKPFPCPKCEKRFRTKYHLKAHDVGQHIQGDTSIGCSQCNRKFASKEALEAHVKTHEEEKQFKCDKCDKGFKTSSRLNLHLKSHDSIPSAVCPKCGKSYKHIRDLRLHEVTHEDESSYRFACGDCPRKFYRIDLLRVHQSNERHFSPEKVGPCVPKHANNTKPIVQMVIPRKNSHEDGIKRPARANATTAKRPSSKQKDKSKVLRKAKTEQHQKPNYKEAFYEPFETTSLFPTMVPIEATEYTPNGLEIMELSHSLNSNLPSSSLRKTPHEPLEQNPFLLSNKDPVIQNLESVPSSSHYALPNQLVGNTDGIPSICETDRNLSTFSISEGAQEVAYDVIRAYLN